MIIVYLLLNHISHVIAPYSQLRSLYPPLSTKYKVSAVKYPPFLFLLLLHFSEEMKFWPWPSLENVNFIDKSYIYNNVFVQKFVVVVFFGFSFWNINRQWTIKYFCEFLLRILLKLKHFSESGSFVSTEIFSPLSSFQARWRNSTWPRVWANT